jgi:hypothetical protein
LKITIEIFVFFSIKFFISLSLYPRLKRPSNDDEQIVKSELLNGIKFQTNQRSNNLSPIISIKMQQQTTNSNLDESANGVPSRFCSVCGDISTGKYFISFLFS